MFFICLLLFFPLTQEEHIMGTRSSLRTRARLRLLLDVFPWRRRHHSWQHIGPYFRAPPALGIPVSPSLGSVSRLRSQGDRGMSRDGVRGLECGDVLIRSRRAGGLVVV